MKSAVLMVRTVRAIFLGDRKTCTACGSSWCSCEKNQVFGASAYMTPEELAERRSLR